MRCLVTGATGHIGPPLVRLLASGGHEIALLLRPDSDSARIADALPGSVRIPWDLADPRSAAPRIEAFRPEAVAHLAWGGVTNSLRDDPQQLLLNLRGSLELLEVAHAAGARTWVGLGSQAEYGLHEGVMREDLPERPVTLYGVSKHCTRQASEGLCRVLGLRFVWLRLFAAYGPWDDPVKLIPSTIATLLRGERPALSRGEQRWDYLFVEDAAEAILAVLAGERARGVYNLASGEAPTVRSIAERIRDLIDPRLPLGLGELPYRADQVMRLEGDTARLRRDTGWRPRVGLEEGLSRTIAWMRARATAGEG